MTSCLDPAAGKKAQLTPRERLHEACDKRAGRRAGAARRGYMTECEKGASAAGRSESAVRADCGKRADRRRLDGGDRRDYVAACIEAARER
jgi:hypothetical protein